MNLYCITCKCPLRDTESRAGKCWSCVEIQMYGELDEGIDDERATRAESKSTSPHASLIANAFSSREDPRGKRLL